MSGTSSGIAYNTTWPNDWIANGSSVGNNIVESDQDDYRVNILESNNPIQDIFQAFQKAKANDNLFNLYDIIVPNGYGSGIYNNYSRKITVNDHSFKLRILGHSDNFSESYYDIYKAGFGYLDRFSNYKPTKLYNGGYYQGFYLTGYDRQYFITIGANTSEGYEYLRNLFHSYE